MGAGVVWSLVSVAKLVWSISFVLLMLSALLSVSLAWMLLVSKPFGEEFFEARNSGPKIKEYLRRYLIAAILVAAILATYEDVRNIVCATS